MPAFAAVLLAACALAPLAPPANPATTTAASTNFAPQPTPIGLTERAFVASVTDGDTVRIDLGLDREPVRLVGINAPELGEPGSAEARAELDRVVDDLEVVLERDVSDRDQFGRLLRYVWVEDAGSLILVNLLLVEGGFARARVYGRDDAHAEALAAAQDRARAAGLGIWAMP